MRKGKTFIISGPSGVGKSTVLKALLERRKNLYFSVSATTREPRPGELDGIHYHFMDVDSFRKWISMEQFLEEHEDGTVPAQEIIPLLDMSFELTMVKPKKRK